MTGTTGDERIDLIAADQALFVDTPPQSASRSPQVLKWIGLIAVVAGAAVVWWPRAEPPKWRVFDAAPVPVAGLTDQLVFDDPDGQLVVAELPPAPEDFEPELGYVFAEPGDTIATGRWASFQAHEVNRSAAQVATEGPLVAGVHADVTRPHFIRWGPVERRNWTVTTNQFSAEEALDFANHVAIVEKRPALANRYDLGALQPVGSVAALDCVQALTEMLRGNRLLTPVRPTVLTWAVASSGPPNPVYEGAMSVGSIPAPPDALPLVEFVLGDGSAITVHGQPAVMIESKALGRVVAWMEDGRLIMVAADVPAEDLRALAQSVRPVHSDGEWRVIQRTAALGFNYGFSNVEPTVVTVYQATDPDTGTAFRVTLSIQTAPRAPKVFFTCAQEESSDGDSTALNCEFLAADPQPQLLSLVEANGRQYAVAIVDPAMAHQAELRVQLPSGAIRVVPLKDFGPEVGWAVAAMVPTGFTGVELWVGGAVVAAVNDF